MRPIGGFPSFSDSHARFSFFRQSFRGVQFRFATARIAFRAIMASLPSSSRGRLIVPTLMCPEMDEIFHEYRNLYSIQYYSFDGDVHGANLGPCSKDDVVLIYKPFGLSLPINLTGEKPITIRDSTHELNLNGSDADYTFASLRKYFPVDSGAVAFLGKSPLDTKARLPNYSGAFPAFLFTKGSLSISLRNWSRSKFLENERRLGIETIAGCSRTASTFFRFSNVRLMTQKRQENFIMLDQALGDVNPIRHLLPDVVSSDSIPFSYPFFSSRPLEVRERLRELGIFTPVLWEGLRGQGMTDFEISLVHNVIHLPLTGDYSSARMGQIFETVKSRQ